MNKSIFGAIGFALGAAAGSLVTWKLVKSKYERIANEEIESVKEEFSKQLADKNRLANDMHNNEFDEEIVDPEFSEEEKKDAEEIVQKQDYSAYCKPKDESKLVKMDRPEPPYIIAPEEFGELAGYNTMSLTFYADQIVADDENGILENVDDVIGFESLNHFGEYEDDSIHVRNNRYKCDYEVLLDSRTYAESLKDKPIRKGYL